MDTPRGEITVPENLIVRISARIWRMAPAQRAHHVETARRKIAAGRFGLTECASVLATDPRSDGAGSGG
jgi:hypothetical protein